jgi:TetR/AcrR family transcriptional repressor of nem operon
MRISRRQVESNRERLLSVALMEFRKHGFDGVGVADVMKEAGMALGSFYGYFDSKEQLIVEVSERAVSGTKALMLEFLENNAPANVARMVDRYLSPEHRDNLSEGCALAALGSEIGHQPEVVRQAVTKELQALFDATEQHLKGTTRAARRKVAMATTASLIGGLILSRLVDDPQLSDQILHAVGRSIKQSNRSANAANQQ